MPEFMVAVGLNPDLDADERFHATHRFIVDGSSQVSVEAEYSPKVPPGYKIMVCDLESWIKSYRYTREAACDLLKELEDE